MSLPHRASPQLTASPATPAQETVTGSAALLTSTAAVTHRLIVQAPAANTFNVWIGDANVTTTRGVELAPGDAWIFYVTTPSALKAISVSGTQKLNLYIE